MNSTDFHIYTKMYQANIHEWYTWYNSLYYTPLFYILFYPFQYSIPIYFILQYIACLRIIYLFLYKYKTYWALFMMPWFYLDLMTSNIDIFITLSIIYILNKKTNYAGLILGLLLFKPITIFIVPLIFYIYFQKINRIIGIDYKKIIFGFIIGSILNFGYFIFDLDLIPIFVFQLSCQTHPFGYVYLLGIQYSWLWYSIFFTVEKFINLKYFNYEKIRIKKRLNLDCNKPRE